MWAREALYEEALLDAFAQVSGELARGDGLPPPRPARFRRGHARRYDRASQLLGEDDPEWSGADRDAVLGWELSARGKPGRFAGLWAGDWQQRRLRELLAELDVELPRGP